MKTGKFQLSVRFQLELVEDVVNHDITLDEIREILSNDYDRWYQTYYLPTIKVKEDEDRLRLLNIYYRYSQNNLNELKQTIIRTIHNYVDLLKIMVNENEKYYDDYTQRLDKYLDGIPNMTVQELTNVLSDTVSSHQEYSKYSRQQERLFLETYALGKEYTKEFLLKQGNLIFNAGKIFGTKIANAKLSVYESEAQASYNTFINKVDVLADMLHSITQQADILKTTVVSNITDLIQRLINTLGE